MPSAVTTSSERVAAKEAAYWITAACIAASVGCRPPPTIDSFTVSATELQGAGTVDLTWSTSNADAVSLSPAVGAVSKTGSTTVVIDSTTAFTLTATGGSATATKTIVTSVVPAPIRGAVVDIDGARVRDARVTTTAGGTSNTDDAGVFTLQGQPVPYDVTFAPADTWSPSNTVYLGVRTPSGRFVLDGQQTEPGPGYPIHASIQPLAATAPDGGFVFVSVFLVVGERSYRLRLEPVSGSPIEINYLLRTSFGDGEVGRLAVFEDVRVQCPTDFLGYAMTSGLALHAGTPADFGTIVPVAVGADVHRASVQGACPDASVEAESFLVLDGGAALRLCEGVSADSGQVALSLPRVPDGEAAIRISTSSSAVTAISNDAAVPLPMTLPGALDVTAPSSGTTLTAAGSIVLSNSPRLACSVELTSLTPPLFPSVRVYSADGTFDMGRITAALRVALPQGQLRIDATCYDAAEGLDTVLGSGTLRSTIQGTRPSSSVSAEPVIVEWMQ